MKRIEHIIFSIILITSIITPVKQTLADDIKDVKARQVGAYFLASQLGNKAITPATLSLSYTIPNVEKDIPAIFIYNTADKHGFVAVSGSDCVDPIIAYSTEYSFDPNNIPPNFQWWLNEQAEVIVYAQNNSDLLEPAKRVSTAWRELEEQTLPYFGTGQKEITTLLTSTWNQSPLYNDSCPTVDGQLAVTGCVATAMAQIIYFWKYPKVGNSSRTIRFNGVNRTIYFSRTYYDYDNMVDALNSNSTPEQIAAVAQLSFHCGAAINMDYGADGSSSYSDKVPLALRKYFKYDADSLRLLMRTEAPYNTNAELWTNTIKSDILRGRPVYYSGYSPDNEGETHSGHAFICHGYNSQTNMFKFNWGWGGWLDFCWCNVLSGELKLKQGPTTYYNFNTRHQVIIGIQPPPDTIGGGSVAINDIDSPFTTEIYPNPAHEYVTISYQLDANSTDADLQIFDVTGRKVDELRLSHASNQVVVPVQNYRPGLYICRLQGKTMKFVVQ